MAAMLGDDRDRFGQIDDLPACLDHARVVEQGPTPAAFDGSMIDHHVRVRRQLRPESLRATLLAFAFPDPTRAGLRPLLTLLGLPLPLYRRITRRRLRRVPRVLARLSPQPIHLHHQPLISRHQLPHQHHQRTVTKRLQVAHTHALGHPPSVPNVSARTVDLLNS